MGPLTTTCQTVQEHGISIKHESIVILKQTKKMQIGYKWHNNGAGNGSTI